MRFLVLGSSGMAGHTVSQYLAERQHEVVGMSRSECPLLHEDVVQVYGDMYDYSPIDRAIKEGEFDIVVNAVGMLNKACDKQPDAAIYLNSYLPHRLASTVENLPTRIFHLSTDCVFAGNTGPYNEASIPDGTTFYDRTKALGEINDDKNLTLRQSIVGPDTKSEGIGLLNWFMQQHRTIFGYDRAIWTGLTTLELSKAIEACALDGSIGLVNMVPDEGGISKYELLQLFNCQLRSEKIEIVPNSSVDIDKTLVRDNYDSSFRPKSYAAQVEEMAEWIENHLAFYPQYRRAMGL